MPKLAYEGLSSEEIARLSRILTSLAHLLPVRWELSEDPEAAELLLTTHAAPPTKSAAQVVRCGSPIGRRAGERWLTLPFKPHEIFALLQELSSAWAVPSETVQQASASLPNGPLRLRGWPLDWWRWPEEELVVVARLAACPGLPAERLVREENRLEAGRALQRLSDEGLLEAVVVPVEQVEGRLLQRRRWWDRAYAALLSLLGTSRAA